MTEAELKNMELHEKEVDLDNMIIHRVVDGWIYEIFSQNPDGNWIMSTTFVPEKVRTTWKRY